MTLPSGFHFSQSNLQDYIDCQRRFQLRYLLRIAWPALETQPATDNENYLRLGAEFHYLIRQHITGVPVELLTASVNRRPESDQNDLAHWWENYLTALEPGEELAGRLFPSLPVTARLFPEINLSIPLGNYRLIAKYDLFISYSTGTFTIIDWKTNRFHPQRHWLQERMQTRVYLYTLAKSGMNVTKNKMIEPERIEMLYWFANFPNEPALMIYSAEQMLQDEAYLLNLIEQIQNKDDKAFPLTHDEKQCKFCVYRSLCDRGTSAGEYSSSEFLESDALIKNSFINMAEIDEIEF